MDAAGIKEPERTRFLEALEQEKPRRGRKPENDSAEILEVIDIANDKEISVNSAAAIVAEKYPPHQREAVRKRLARKAREGKYESPKPNPADIRKEMDRLRLRAIFAHKTRD